MMLVTEKEIEYLDMTYMTYMTYMTCMTSMTFMTAPMTFVTVSPL